MKRIGSKIKNFSHVILTGMLALVFSEKVQAQSGQFWYGNVSTGSPPPVTRMINFTDLEWWNLERLLAFAVLPIVLVIIVIVGLVTFIKHKRKENAQRNNEIREAEIVDNTEGTDSEGA